MRLKLEPRTRPSRLMTYGSPVLALLLTLLFGAFLFAWVGKDPIATLQTYFVSPINSWYGVSEWLLKAMPLTLIGLGLAIGFRANVWNIGAEGQLLMGAVGGGGIALALWGEGVPGTFLLVCLAGAGAGLAFGAIPAFLKVRFNANEILTSLMLIYIADQFLGYLVHGAFKNPAGFGFPESRLFSPEALMPILMEGTRLHIGALLVPLATIAAWLLLSRTIVGFQVKVAGMAAPAAAYAGFSQSRMVWLSFLLTGALAGLVGAMEVAGPVGQLLPEVSPGYGFAAIIVAFLGRLSPIGVLLAGHLMALILIGGENVQLMMGVPIAVTGVFQGALLFFLLACDVLVRYRVRLTGRAATAAAAHDRTPQAEAAE
jgi:simple sugar transport system permease protein